MSLDRPLLLQQIAARAMTLQERVTPGAYSTVGTGAVAAARLDAWIAALGGDRAAVARRLGDGRDPACILADQDDPPPEPIRARWLDLIEDVLEMAPGRPAPWLMPLADRLPFGHVLLPFLQAADTRLNADPDVARARALLSRDAQLDLLTGLGRDLLDILGAPLLDAFDRARPSGPVLMARFAGVTGSEPCGAYERFVQRMTSEALGAFLRDYAAGARLAASVMSNWVTGTAALLRRLQADADQIAGMIGQTGAQLMIDRIDPRLSEPHDGGQCVQALTTQTGARFVYKPRPMGGEALWSEVLRALPLDLEERLPVVLDRADYGWMSWVGHEGCTDAAAAERFFRRSGAVLALAFVLGAKDLHFENIIASGEHPVVVDLETLLQPDPEVFGTPESLLMLSQVTREVSFLRSVIRTEYLPRGQAPVAGDSFVGSALATPEEGTLQGVTWVGQNSDVMHLAQQPRPTPMVNLPTLDGRSVWPGDHADAFIAGFEAAGQVIAEHRDRVLALLDRRGTLRFRCIFRATRTYFGIRQSACRAENLRSGIEFGIALEPLWRAVDADDMPARLQEIVRAEIASMTQGDIPRFSAEAGCRDLDGGLTVPVARQFTTTGLDHVRARLDEAGRPEWGRNLEIVRAVLSALPRTSRPNRSAALPQRRALDQSEALSEAERIGRGICDAAWPMEEGSYWTGLVYRLPHGGFQCDPLNDGFYEGNTGIGFFLAALHRATGEAAYREAALRAFAPLRRFVARHGAAGNLAEAFGLGLGGGLGGIAAGWAQAGYFLADPSLIADASALLAAVPATFSAQEDAELLLGVSGVMVGAATVQGLAPDDRHLDVMARGADWLMADVPRGDPGPPGAAMAHGAGGPVLALAAAHRLCGDPRYREAALHRLQKARRQRDKDPHCDGHHGRVQSGWCWGEAGELVAAMAADLPDDAASVRQLAHRLAQAPGSPLDQICCGAFGVVDSLVEASARLSDATLLCAARTLAAKVVDRARDDGGYALLAGVGRGYRGPSLFQGMAGIGYGLLRIADPQRTPSLVALGLPDLVTA